MSTYSDVTRLRAEALAVDPVRFLLAAVAIPFVVLGVVLRIVWMVPAFCFVAGRDGWLKTDEAIRVRAAEARRP